MFKFVSSSKSFLYFRFSKAHFISLNVLVSKDFSTSQKVHSKDVMEQMQKLEGNLVEKNVVPENLSSSNPVYGFFKDENRIHIHPKVRNSYKRIMLSGREYPKGLDWVRSKAKPWFRQNASLTDEIEILRAVNVAQFWDREIKALVRLKKYRAMKNRYSG